MMRYLFGSKKSIALTILAFVLLLSAGSAFLFYRSVGKVVKRERENIDAEKNVEVKENQILLQRLPGYELLTSISEINDLCPYQGLYFAATNGGLIAYDGTGHVKACYTTLDRLPVNYLQALAVYRDRLIIGTRGAGILIFDGKQFSHLCPKDKKYANVTTLHPTPQGILFIGTQSGGVLAYDGSRLERFNSAVLGKQHITSFSGDSNDLEVATYSGGLYTWKEGKLTHYDKAKGLLDSQVTSLLRAGKDLYAGTPLGITQMEAGSIKGKML